MTLIQATIALSLIVNGIFVARAFKLPEDEQPKHHYNKIKHLDWSDDYPPFNEDAEYLSTLKAGAPITEEEKQHGRLRSWKDPSIEQIKWFEENEGIKRSPEVKPKNSLFYIDMRWPNDIVPYVVEDAIPQEDRLIIGAAFADIEENSCVRFRRKKDDDKDFIYIFSTGAGICQARQGYHGPGFGAHAVSLEKNGCFFTRVVVHEIMHSLGFGHEQNRPDRNAHVKINWANIQDGMAFNFFRDYGFTSEGESVTGKFCKEGAGSSTFDDCTSSLFAKTYGTEYEYSSVMHYYFYSNAINDNEMTVIPHNTSVEYEKFPYLTPMDQEKLRRAYHCNMEGGTKCGGHHFSDVGGDLSGVPIANTGECFFYLQTDSSKVVVLNLKTEFDGPCSSDHLEIRKGYRWKNELIGTFCKDKPLPENFDTGSHVISLDWRTTKSTLQGNWVAAKGKCCDRYMLTSDNDKTKKFYGEALGIYTKQAETYKDGFVYKNENGKYCTWKNDRNLQVITECWVGFDYTGGHMFGTPPGLCPTNSAHWELFNSDTEVIYNDITMMFTCADGTADTNEADERINKEINKEINVDTEEEKNEEVEVVEEVEDGEEEKDEVVDYDEEVEVDEELEDGEEEKDEELDDDEELVDDEVLDEHKKAFDNEENDESMT